MECHSDAWSIFAESFSASPRLRFTPPHATPLSAATSGHSIPWASLGVVRPSLLQPSGWGSPIAAEPKNTNIAWCAQKGVEIASGSGKATFVPDSSVEQMLKASHLGVQDSPGSSKVAVTCEDIALDPNHPKIVFAGFQASLGGSIPPVYEVVLVTSNLGRSWRFVPSPHGYSLADFAGFIARPGGVTLLYSHKIFFPMKPGQTAALVAASSSTGGQSWTDARLDCTAGATCVMFGPQAPQGACGMSEWQQSVLVATAASGTASSLWREAVRFRR